MVVGIWLYMSTGLFGFFLKKTARRFLEVSDPAPALSCEAVTKGGGPQLTFFKFGARSSLTMSSDLDSSCLAT